MDNLTDAGSLSSRIEEIIRRHVVPSLVTDFKIRFDELYGQQVVYIALKPQSSSELDLDSMRHRGKSLHRLTTAITSDIYDEVPDWVPRVLIEAET